MPSSVHLQRRPSVIAHPPVGFMPGLQSSEAHYPNTSARELRGAAWERLLSRVGDAVMVHLLLHASIFLALPNGCFLQVSGMPAPQVCPSEPMFWGLRVFLQYFDARLGSNILADAAKTFFQAFAQTI